MMRLRHRSLGQTRSSGRLGSIRLVVRQTVDRQHRSLRTFDKRIEQAAKMVGKERNLMMLQVFPVIREFQSDRPILVKLRNIDRQRVGLRSAQRNDPYALIPKLGVEVDDIERHV